MTRALRVAVGALAIAAAAFPAKLHASDYPNKPIRIINAFAPGAATDNIARVVADGLSKRLGQPVVVENRVGGSGNIGSQYVAQAAPDGYTLLITTQTLLAVSPHMHSNLGFDPVKDFEPITLAVYSPLVLIVSPKLPVKSVKELIDYVKENKGKVSYAMAGVGTNSHMGALLFNSVAGLDAVAIPHPGEAPAVPQIVGGHLPYMFVSVPSGAPFVNNNQVRALAVTGSKRAALLPDVPTMAEQGVKDFEVATWWAFVGPRGMPKDIVNKLNASFVEVLKDPTVQERITKMGYELRGTSVKELVDYIDTENARWGKIVKEQGLATK
jgi:tripartite-type tricarboxylate transporter receptor subunit TctC